MNQSKRVEIAVPHPRVRGDYFTNVEARSLIVQAAGERRIGVGDFVGRSALAFAAYDLDISWRTVSRFEHSVVDQRLYKRRVYYFGREFGFWEIESLYE